MRTHLALFLSATLSFGLSACGDQGGTPPAGSGTAAKPAQSQAAGAKTSASAAKPAGSAATSASSAAGEERGKMSNCPNAAPGAKTEVKDVDKGVEVVVTADDPKGVEEIKARAKGIGERAKGEAGSPQHTGKGGGGGAMGRCPIVVGGTDVKVEETDKGAKFTVTTAEAKEVDWLRRETKERLAVLQEPGDEGERRMENCPSAVAGAKTTVKDAAGSVVVTVVAKDVKDEASVKAIRERAKKAAETKHEGDGKTHDGKGAGGAKEGRCPAVLDGVDTTVKEVDGGAELTLKPKKKEDAKKLLEEAQDRAKQFGG